jgi:anthranilate phosphoribosyltransferase
VDVASAIARAVERRHLSTDEMADVIGRVFDGEATPAQIGALLVALRMKGETVGEVVGAARAMRARCVKLRVPDGVVVDTCGTGGDGRGTVNVSTIAALVVAAAGVRVAKHGNRALSSRCGSAEVLEKLGVDVGAGVEVVERCLRDVGIGFLFAPAFHAATRHASAPRREIGVRTLFNLLGPLTNPAGARHQLIGVYDGALIESVARVLGELGSEHVLVVHGAGGLDEFAPAGATEVAELRGGEVKKYRLTPRDFGLADSDPAGLLGGDADENARLARAILAGRGGGAPEAARNCVIMTAAGALYAAGATGLRDGARRAAELLDDGSAARVLERLAAATRTGAGSGGASGGSAA